MSLETLKTKVGLLIEKAQSGGGGTEEIENIIDQSGVLDSTDGTATKKVEALIDKAEDENLWYSFSELTTASFGFGGMLFEKIPRINPVKVTSVGSLCSAMPNLKRVDFYINAESATSCNNMFSNCPLLEFVKGVNTSKATKVIDMFSYSYALKTIEMPLDLSSVTSANNIMMIRGNTSFALEDIRFVEGSIHWSFYMARCPYLSNESKQSLFDGLATVETAQTLTLPENLKILQSQVDSANAKGWTVAGGTVVSEEEYYG